MTRWISRYAIFAAMGLGLGIAPAAAQDAEAGRLIALEVEAMRVMAAMDGEWRGEAVTQTPNGVHKVVHTERIGTLLGGSIRLVEGHSYAANGETGFNAFGVISYNPATKAYTLSSNAGGRSGQFAIVPTANGYVWQIPAGPTTIRYTAVIENGRWIETGERIVAGKALTPFFRMELKRLGDSKWPAAGAVPIR